MSQISTKILVSLSNSGGIAGELADDILYGSLPDSEPVQQPELTPALSRICEIFHISNPTSLEYLAQRILPHVVNKGDEQSDADMFISKLTFDEDKMQEYYNTYKGKMATLSKTEAFYVFGSTSFFNKTNEENYAWARALIDVYGSDGDYPELWLKVITFKGRILDAD